MKNLSPMQPKAFLGVRRGETAEPLRRIHGFCWHLGYLDPEQEAHVTPMQGECGQ